MGHPKQGPQSGPRKTVGPAVWLLLAAVVSTVIFIICYRASLRNAAPSGAPPIPTKSSDSDEFWSFKHLPRESERSTIMDETLLRMLPSPTLTKICEQMVTVFNKPEGWKFLTHPSDHHRFDERVKEPVEDTLARHKVALAGAIALGQALLDRGEESEDSASVKEEMVAVIWSAWQM